MQSTPIQSPVRPNPVRVPESSVPSSSGLVTYSENIVTEGAEDLQLSISNSEYDGIQSIHQDMESILKNEKIDKTIALAVLNIQRRYESLISSMEARYV